MRSDEWSLTGLLLSHSAGEPLGFWSFSLVVGVLGEVRIVFKVEKERGILIENQQEGRGCLDGHRGKQLALPVGPGLVLGMKCDLGFHTGSYIRLQILLGLRSKYLEQCRQ